jgi:hypothetical protein
MLDIPMKKNILLWLNLFFISNLSFGQSNLILPQGATFNVAGNLLKTADGTQGYSHTNNIVGVGTFVSGNRPYIQSHTPHSLYFAVNNGSPAMTLSYSTWGIKQKLGNKYH